MEAEAATNLVTRMWSALGGSATATEEARVSGPERILPSVFDVTGLAAAMITVATLAVAELSAVRDDTPIPAVSVARRQACAAFVSEVLFAPNGWQRTPVWDPIAGDYPASDGWIRLHTNYRHHREAVEKVLGAATDRASVAAEVQRWSARELQDAIVESGGCAAAMNTRSEWLRSPAGRSTGEESIVHLRSHPVSGPPRFARIAGGRPLSGIKVLDLTRVIAGPVCTRFLAAYGADVLRIDPRGFEEVPALLPETTAGKHCTELDLGDPHDRTVFDMLLADADVIVTGLRPGALGHLGYDGEALRAVNPDLVIASLNAYGWSGPWASRRGFDSLVQMSCGIAAAGSAASRQDRPVPLPAQALDHGTGYLLAAAVCRALTDRLTTWASADVRCSLVATANLLFDHPTPRGLDGPPPEWSPTDTEPTGTAWGPARRVPTPGRIDGIPAQLDIEAGPLGRDAPSWTAR